MASEINRRDFLKGAIAGTAAGLVGLPATASTGKAGASKPNILFIMSDQHKALAMGCYGNEDVKTPVFDSMAANGIRFHNAFVQSPLCIPSRACLLTGKYPQSHGLQHKNRLLSSDEVFLADVLRDAGYWVGSVGKMHHIPPTDKRGFADLYDIPMWERGKAGMAKIHTKNVAGTPNQFIHGISGLAPENHPTAQLTNKAITQLKDRAAEPDRPFLLWVSYVPPHHPCLPPQEYADMYDPAKIALPPNFNKPRYYATWHLRMMQQYFNTDYPTDENAIRTFIARYYGEISLIDFNIGRILKALDELGLAENTLVIYTADHGDFAGEHGTIMKGDVYDPLTRVPLIMRFPGQYPRGKTVDQLVEQIDLMPTFLDFAGVEIPGTVQGETLVPLVRGETDTHKDYIFSMIRTWHMRQARYAVRSRRWLYVEDTFMDREMLFDLEKDPWQTDNVILLPRNESVLRTYRERLRYYFEGPYEPRFAEDLPRQMQTEA